MKRLVSVLAILAVLPAWGADAPSPEAIVCHKVGYTANPAKFHDIALKNKVNTFVIEGTQVVFRDKAFNTMNADKAGLEGLAKTYWSGKDQRVLYIYKNERGQDEVAISRSAPDSDAGFSDKALYTECSLLHKTDTTEGMKDGPAEPLPSSSPQPASPASEVRGF